MRVVGSPLPGVLLIEPDVFEDERGFFVESYQEERYQRAGIACRFVQDNHARSFRGVLRGLHYQLETPQAKLVRVVRGEVFDVAADVRKGSPTFGKWFGTVLSEENKLQLFVPEGFAHGYCALSQEADFEYKCSALYQPEDQKGVLWCDPDLAVAWPIADPVLSDQDMKLPLLSVAELPTYCRQ